MHAIISFFDTHQDRKSDYIFRFSTNSGLSHAKSANMEGFRSVIKILQARLVNLAYLLILNSNFFSKLNTSSAAGSNESARHDVKHKER